MPKHPGSHKKKRGGLSPSKSSFLTKIRPGLKRAKTLEKKAKGRSKKS